VHAASLPSGERKHEVVVYSCALDSAGRREPSFGKADRNKRSFRAV
jgi:hypothetical protein